MENIKALAIIVGSAILQAMMMITGKPVKASVADDRAVEPETPTGTATVIDVYATGGIDAQPKQYWKRENGEVIQITQEEYLRAIEEGYVD